MWGCSLGQAFAFVWINEARDGNGVGSVVLLGTSEGTPTPGAGPRRERELFSGTHGGALQELTCLCHDHRHAPCSQGIPGTICCKRTCNLSLRPSGLLTWSPFSHPSLIDSSERVSLPLGSQQSLAHSGEPGPSLSS